MIIMLIVTSSRNIEHETDKAVFQLKCTINLDWKVQNKIIEFIRHNFSKLVDL